LRNPRHFGAWSEDRTGRWPRDGFGKKGSKENNRDGCLLYRGGGVKAAQSKRRWNGSQWGNWALIPGRREKDLSLKRREGKKGEKERTCNRVKEGTQRMRTLLENVQEKQPRETEGPETSFHGKRTKEERNRLARSGNGGKTKHEKFQRNQKKGQRRN